MEKLKDNAMQHLFDVSVSLFLTPPVPYIVH